MMAAAKKANGPLPVRPVSIALQSHEGCLFPLWPHGAKFGHPKYGTYCGKARHDELASYCTDHLIEAYRELPTKQQLASMAKARAGKAARHGVVSNPGNTVDL